MNLLTLSPGLEERLNTGTEDDLIYISTMVRTSNSQLVCDSTYSELLSFLV